MNKKIIVFVCILSLLVPFIPSFDFVLFADDSVSSDSAFIKWEKDNVDAIRNGLADNGTVVNPDFYFVTDDTLNPNLWQIIARYYNLDYELNVGKPLNRQIYDYTVSNNISPSDIYNNCFNTIYNELNDYKSYFVYTTLHGSDLYDLFLPYNGTNGSQITLDLNHFNSLSLPNDNSVYFITTHNRSMAYEFTNNSSLNFLNVYEFSFDFFNDNFVYLTNYDDSRSFASALDNNHFYRVQPLGGVVPPFNSSIMYKFYFGGSNNNVYQTVSSNLYTYRYNSNQFNFSSVQNLSSFGFLPLIRCGVSTSRPNMFEGGFFLVPDSLDNFSFPVFKDYSSYFDFVSGNSFVYDFSSDLDLSNYGSDLNLDKLYDVISDSVSSSQGNVIQAINNAADNYLKQQIDLLHDINNALNDGNGQSWLRRIYGILDYNFPLTLSSFEELIDSIQNISVNGGGSDLTHINLVLDEINSKLGFMIENPLTDADIQDMESLKNLAQQKFPFCVFSDVVAISVILNRPPVQPHWIIPLKLPGSSSVNNIEVDLSWYEEIRDLVQGVFIFIFIVGLLALSVKIFSALKS